MSTTAWRSWPRNSSGRAVGGGTVAAAGTGGGRLPGPGGGAGGGGAVPRAPPGLRGPGPRGVSRCPGRSPAHAEALRDRLAEIRGVRLVVVPDGDEITFRDHLLGRHDRLRVRGALGIEGGLHRRRSVRQRRIVLVEPVREVAVNHGRVVTLV